MFVWRICRQKHVPDAFSGFGAEKYGGRWNHKGDRMVYASTSLSLAAMELFVHLQPDVLPADLHSAAVTVPDGISSEVVAVGDLPANWRSYPAPGKLQEIGSTWLRKMRSLLLVVPSAVNPDEQNVLINPLHPEIRSITAVQSKPFHFDPRMWK